MRSLTEIVGEFMVRSTFLLAFHLHQLTGLNRPDSAC